MNCVMMEERKERKKEERKEGKGCDWDGRKERVGIGKEGRTGLGWGKEERNRVRLRGIWLGKNRKERNRIRIGSRED